MYTYKTLVLPRATGTARIKFERRQSWQVHGANYHCGLEAETLVV